MRLMRPRPSRPPLLLRRDGSGGIHPNSQERKVFDTGEMDHRRRGACEEERRRALGLWTEREGSLLKNLATQIDEEDPQFNEQPAPV